MKQCLLKLELECVHLLRESALPLHSGCHLVSHLLEISQGGRFLESCPRGQLLCSAKLFLEISLEIRDPRPIPLTVSSLYSFRSK